MNNAAHEAATPIDIPLTTIAHVFGRRASHRFLVSPCGVVRVWDDIAGHYTTCHSMSKKQQRRVRCLADREQAMNETVIQMIDEDGFVEAEDSAAGFAEANAESPEVLEAIEKIVAGSASEAAGFFTLRAVRR